LSKKYNKNSDRECNNSLCLNSKETV